MSGVGNGLDIFTNMSYNEYKFVCFAIMTRG